MIQLLFSIALLLPFQASPVDDDPDAITGLWITPGDKSIIQIENKMGQLTAKILRIHPEGYIQGIAPMDEKNVNASLRSRSLEGITILSGITYDKKKETWQIKQIYDPERGKYFEGYIVMQGANKLKLRGHVPGKKWLGQTEIWKRVDGAAPY